MQAAEIDTRYLMFTSTTDEKAIKERVDAICRTILQGYILQGYTITGDEE